MIASPALLDAVAELRRKERITARDPLYKQALFLQSTANIARRREGLPPLQILPWTESQTKAAKLKARRNDRATLDRAFTARSAEQREAWVTAWLGAFLSATRKLVQAGNAGTADTILFGHPNAGSHAAYTHDFQMACDCIRSGVTESEFRTIWSLGYVGAFARVEGGNYLQRLWYRASSWVRSGQNPGRYLGTGRNLRSGFVSARVRNAAEDHFRKKSARRALGRNRRGQITVRTIRLGCPGAFELPPPERGGLKWALPRAARARVIEPAARGRAAALDAVLQTRTAATAALTGALSSPVNPPERTGRPLFGYLAERSRRREQRWWLALRVGQRPGGRPPVTITSIANAVRAVDPSILSGLDPATEKLHTLVRQALPLLVRAPRTVTTGAS